MAGFVDAEGYFLIQEKHSKSGDEHGEPIIYRRFSFVFNIHLSIKEKNTLITIKELLGGIGNITDNKDSCLYTISGRKNLDQLLSIMRSYFLKLNTTKVLNFLDWDKARNLYLEYLDNKAKGVPNHKNPEYEAVCAKIISLKKSSNAARIDHKLPLNPKVTITKYWLLGFIEGEGCFSYHSFSMYFSLAHTRVNRHVLVSIRDYLLNYAPGKVNISITDKNPSKGNQKPYSVLLVSGNPNCSATLIPALIDLRWFSVKRYSFIYAVIIYLLVAEGKHLLKIGSEIISSLDLRINKSCEYNNNLSISQQIIDLLFSGSNYTETEQEGILKVSQSHNKIKKVHTTDSYLLVSSKTDGVSFGFKSNADCAKYFSVSKVTIGRWTAKNSFINTKKGTFLFKKARVMD